MGVGLLGYFVEFGDDVWWCGFVGVVYVYVDDVFVMLVGCEFEFGCDVEDVGWEVVDVCEMVFVVGSGRRGYDDVCKCLELFE